MLFPLFKIKDQIFFTQRLSLLLDSNLPLIKSLEILKSIEKDSKKIKIFNSIIIMCNKGIGLSKALENTDSGFNKILITLIKNGEISGTLTNSLLQISDYLEKKNELKKKIISISIYPLFIFIATILMSLFLIMYIFPKILPMLSSLNIKLPLITSIIKSIYEYSISYGLYFLIIILIFIISFYILINKSINFKGKLQSISLSIPIIKDYIKLNINTSLCNIAGIFLQSNKSLSEFYIFTIDSLNNLIYKKAFIEINELSIKGVSLSTSLRKFENLFPIVMINMCEIGERTGNLANMLNYCSRIFEQDLDMSFKRLSSMIEPILMTLMGIVVGTIALSIILPVYEITNHLSK